MEMHRIGGTNQNAQSTANTAQVIGNGDSIRDRQGLKLAALDACFTAIACISFHYDLKIRACNGAHDSELGDAAHDAATADTAIADVINPITVVAGGMHQPGFFRLAQDLQRFFFGDGAIDFAPVEGMLDGRKDQTCLNRMGAVLPHEPLLHTAYAVTHTP